MSQENSEQQQSQEYSDENIVQQQVESSSESNQSNDSNSSVQNKISICSQTKQQQINYRWQSLFETEVPQKKEDLDQYNKIQKQYQYLSDRYIKLQPNDTLGIQLLLTMLECEKCKSAMLIPFTKKSDSQQNYQKLCHYCVDELKVNDQYEYSQHLYDLSKVLLLQQSDCLGQVFDSKQDFKCDICKEKVIVPSKIQLQKYCIFCNRVYCEKCLQTGVMKQIFQISLEDMNSIMNIVPDSNISLMNPVEQNILLSKMNRDQIFTKFQEIINKKAYTSIQTYKPIYLDKNQYCCKHCYSLLFNLICNFMRQNIVDTRPYCLLGTSCNQQWSDIDHQQKYQHFGKGLRDLTM